MSPTPLAPHTHKHKHKDEKEATLQRIRTIVKNEGKCRLPKEMKLIEQMATRHARHNGGTDITPTCLFDHVVRAFVSHSL
jgi:hypothetical protein